MQASMAELKLFITMRWPMRLACRMSLGMIMPNIPDTRLRHL